VTVLGAGVGILLVKALIAGGVALALGMSTRAAVIIGLSLSQIGEFSFVLSGRAYPGLLDFTATDLSRPGGADHGRHAFIINMAPRLAEYNPVAGTERFESAPTSAWPSGTA